MEAGLGRCRFCAASCHDLTLTQAAFRMRRIHYLPVLLGVFFLAACGAAPPERSVCADEGWSDAQVLADSSDVLVNPYLVVGDSLVFLIGSTFTPFQPAGPNGHVLRRLGGASSFFSDNPYHVFPAAAALDSKGTLHVLWGEPPDTTSAPVLGPTPNITDFYYRSYSEGRWSAREQVFHYPHGIHWDTYPAPQLIVDAHDGVQFIFNIYHRLERAGTFHYARKEAQGWMIRDTGFRGGYPFLAAHPSGHLLLAFIAVSTSDNDRNSVFFTLSADQGQVWEEPVLVSRSEERGAHTPQIVLMPSGQIHLLWIKDLDQQGSGRIIWHATSKDGGKTWGEPLEIGTALGGFVHNFQTVATPDGCMHMVFERESAFFSNDRKLYYTRWDGQGWIEPEDLFPETYSLDFSLAATEDGTRHLVWIRIEPGGWPFTGTPLPEPGGWPQQVYVTSDLR